MNVALLGFGVVGKGVYDLLINEHPHIHIKYILEKNESLLTNLLHLKAPSIDVILNDPEIDIVIELIGGKGVAYTFVKAALTAGKHVVTANKALMSAYFKELIELAKKHQVNLLYEASVGGAMIVLDPLKTIRHANPIHTICGIMNGSTNFVLTKIFDDDLSLSDALSEALKLGYLETGSSDDMDGLDLLRKINILSMMAYETIIDEASILNMPLSWVSQRFMTYIKSKGYHLKYVAYSHLENDTITIDVTPMVIDPSHRYIQIKNEYNIIELMGKYHEKQTFIGQGAGRYPTASAVVYDMLHINQTVDHTSYQKRYAINPSPRNQTFLIEYEDGTIKQTYTSLAQILADKHVVCAAILGEKYEDL